MSKTSDTQIIARLNEIHDAQAAGGSASFASLTGDPSDNAALASALNAKQSEAEVQAIADAKVESEAYGPTWDGDTTHAPSKNDVYDKIEAVVASIPAAPSKRVTGSASFDGSNVAGATVSGVVASVARNEMGSYQIVFTASQAAYIPVANANNAGAGDPAAYCTIPGTTRSDTEFRVMTFQQGLDLATEPTLIEVLVFQ